MRSKKNENKHNLLLLEDAGDFLYFSNFFLEMFLIGVFNIANFNITNYGYLIRF